MIRLEYISEHPADQIQSEPGSFAPFFCYTATNCFIS